MNDFKWLVILASFIYGIFMCALVFIDYNQNIQRKELAQICLNSDNVFTYDKNIVKCVSK